MTQFIALHFRIASLMVASVVQVAKRALLATLRAVALTVGMALKCSRDSPDREVVSNFGRLALRVHPDRLGGSAERIPGAARKGRQWTGTSSLGFRCAATKVHAILEMRVLPGSGRIYQNVFGVYSQYTYICFV